MEQILRSRNPNSLPALIFAAASAQDSAHLLSDPADPSSCPSRVTELLERKVQRLEAELEAYDEDAKRSLRAMEQQFQMCYEQRISELEQKREEKQGSDPGLVQSLREELRRERDAHRQNEIMLEEFVGLLVLTVSLCVLLFFSQSHSSPSRHQRQADAAFRLRMERLNQELSTKSRTIQDLTRTVERLQRERRSMLSVPVPRAEGRAAEEKRPAAQNKSAPESDVTAEMFPALNVCEKTYQPTTFTGEGRRATTPGEGRSVPLQVRFKCKPQIKIYFFIYFFECSTLLQQLQEQLSEAQSWRRALTVSQAREDALQTQLSRCLDDLKEARDGHSPEVKLLWTLEKKVQDMERRQQHRDRELQMIGAALPGGVDLQMEVERWKRLAQNKTRELDSFRLELDSILDIIRHLQRQGVVLPAPPVLPAPLAPPLLPAPPTR
uniref:Centrosomal protein of 162 kDa n=1 Tax=Periophthalmus magnuspinnatus TaxID=409849 RepID=A0A3B3ZA27_9GOBI